MSERAYFDWNATAPLREEARTAVVEALRLTGNASSGHEEGRAARRLVEEARDQVAALAGAEAKNVTFTSGATEANMLALTPALQIAGDKAPRDRLFVSAIEHPSVRCGGRFASGEVSELVVDANGVVDCAALEQALTKAERPLVSVMLANNETGVIQPISAIAEIVHRAGGLLHVDAVQAPGRIACDMAALGADLMSLSAHKLGGPQGAGALIRQNTGFGDIHIADPLIKGGGQERSQRAGTENVAAIAGFGAAAAAAQAAGQADAVRMAALRDPAGSRPQGGDAGSDHFWRRRRAPAQYHAVHGSRAEGGDRDYRLRSQWHSAVFRGRLFVRRVQPSHVLAAMGVSPDLARGALRVSLGRSTSEAEVEQFLGTWIMLAGSLVKGRRELAA